MLKKLCIFVFFKTFQGAESSLLEKEKDHLYGGRGGVTLHLDIGDIF